jgi:hypothetical protein
MKRITLALVTIAFAVMAMWTTRVAAQDTNTQERTFMTFSNTVEMPGVTLPAGTYIFQLADTPTRNVVQVMSQDQKSVLGQWTFVQARRPKATGDTVVMFKENKEGTTPAVQYWYYPGESIGKEFIYPKDQAEKIAARTGQSVLTEEGRVEGSSAADVAAANAQANNNVASNQNDTDRTLQNSPAPSQPTAAAGSTTGVRGSSANDNDNDRSLSAKAQSDNRVGTSGNAEPSAVDTRAPESTQARASELPRTASPAPLIGLIGLLSLAGALGARKLALAE